MLLYLFTVMLISEHYYQKSKVSFIYVLLFLQLIYILWFIQ